MNRIIISILAAFSILAATSCATAQTPFSALKNEKDVTHVYLSKAMMALAGKSLSSDLLIDKSSSINTIEVFECSSPKSIAKAREILAQYMNTEPTPEEIVTVNKNNEETLILGVPSPSKPNTYSSMIIVNFEKKEADIVILSGSITFNSDK